MMLLNRSGKKFIHVLKDQLRVALKAFLLSVLGKFRSEDNTTKTIRTKIEPRLSELIEQINLIVADIEGKEKKKVLVLIDDMDKPNLDQAKKIFYDYNTAITQPACSIVFTVPISIFFSQEFTGLSGKRGFFFPNVKLHFKRDDNKIGRMKRALH